MAFSLRPTRSHLIGFCVFMTLLYYWINVHFSHHTTVENTESIRVSTTHKKKLYEVRYNNWCNYPLPFKNVVKPDNLCQLRALDKSMCGTIESYFFSKPPAKCDSSQRVDYCGKALKDEKEVLVCDWSLCDSGLTISYLDITTGEMKENTVPHYSNSHINKLYHGLVYDTETKHSGYIFVKCDGDEISSQLIILPVMPKKTPVSKQDQVNINIIFIDSVSYMHFHRSLPRTVSTLESIQKHSYSVYSYPLFQSLKSRTFENLQALFSGRVDPNLSFGTLAMPPTKLKLEALFGPLKSKGYHTLYLEDLCWLWEWGISKDLQVHNKTIDRTTYWQRLREAFHQAAILSYGISPSSCEILEGTGKPDPFHDVPAVCHNGQFQHDFIFEYLLEYQRAYVRAGTPYASISVSNLPHDEYGRRVQTMDSSLSDYISASSELEDTLTILLADHGNAYGDFVKTQQGRLETYHPILYLIIPERTRAKLGSEVMEHLSTNQGRLVTMQDLHYLLKYVALDPNTAERKGLIGSLPTDRTCGDLTLYEPNICLCDGAGGDNLLSSQVLKQLAEFAAGYLSNDMIEKVGGSAKANCRILLPQSYSEPQIISQKKGMYKVTMTLNFNSPLSENEKETILVTVRYQQTDGRRNNNGMQLIAYERTSQYGIYRSCYDKSATENRCICEKGIKYHLNLAQNMIKYKRESDSQLVAATVLTKLSDCVYLITFVLRHSQSYSLYLANVCEAGVYKVDIGVSHKDGITPIYSTPPLDGAVVNPNSVLFTMVLELRTEIQNVTATDVLQFHVNKL